jgi:hypothetical protein
LKNKYKNVLEFIKIDKEYLKFEIKLGKKINLFELYKMTFKVESLEEDIKELKALVIS